MPEKSNVVAAADREPVALVVQQHTDEVAHLRMVRGLLVHAPHVRMLNIRRLDDRIAAHLDGLSVAGRRGRELSSSSLASPGVGELFGATVCSIEAGDEPALGRLLSVAEAVPEAMSGLTSAFGWVSGSRLQGLTKAMLESTSSFRQLVGVTTCAMHRVDPGLASSRWMQAGSAAVRARALRTAGEIGLLDAQPHAAAALSDEDPSCKFSAAWSGVLLGNRGVALDSLVNEAFTAGPYRATAFRLSLQALPAPVAHSRLQELARAPEQLRRVIEGSGIVGDITYVPWLISQMSPAPIARLAGEAFSLISGVDLSLQDLEGSRPEDFAAGPNDNPDDPNVEIDPDEGLPWPDVDKIKAWWGRNSARFQSGTRYFMGQPVTREHCIEVLKNGYQRQRILAAHYLCLLDPGTPLFNTSAPAWRQQKLLAQMK
jgi:uncharacterized protein (TIGR02270 family)